MTTPSNAGADASREYPAAGPWFIDPYRNICDARGKAVDFHDPANAAFIVRACNSHYELLEALDGLLPDFTGGLDPTEPECVVKARAAIAKARPPAGETK